MFNFIEKLRQKPAHAKKQISFLVALSVAGIIFVMWLSVIYPDFRQSQDREQKASQLEPSPVSAFRQTLETGVSEIKDQFSKLKDTISSFSTDPAHYRATTTISNFISTSTNQY